MDLGEGKAGSGDEDEDLKRERRVAEREQKDERIESKKQESSQGASCFKREKHEVRERAGRPQKA